MKYLNLGCGVHYSKNSEWTNLDFVSGGEHVLAHNLLKGIPFSENTFDLVYHSHVLEHFSKEDGEKFVAECFRVLKPGGIVRVVIPDLENIAKEYLNRLAECLRNPEDSLARANYDWMLIEMYDQTVRTSSGGEMVKYLHQDNIINEDFVFSRVGGEGKSIRRRLNDLQSKKTETYVFKPQPLLFRLLNPKTYVRKIKNLLLQKELKELEAGKNFIEIGKFRLGGEVHQWMYDSYSLSVLLKSKGGKQVQKRNAFTSYIDNWSSYGLDGKDNITRKPDSLYMEAIKG